MHLVTLIITIKAMLIEAMLKKESNNKIENIFKINIMHTYS